MFKRIFLFFLLSCSVETSSFPSYNREDYGRWKDFDDDCQDTRQEVLIEESKIPVTFATEKQCKVASGLWVDPYSGEEITDPSTLDIDHLVPLHEAHVSGGAYWNKDIKNSYFNYLNNSNHLVATHKSLNRSKGAKNPSEWMPAVNQCWYIQSWIEIKNEWNLNISCEESQFLLNYLKNNCIK